MLWEVLLPSQDWFYRDIKKNILWLWFIPRCSYKFLHCRNVWFSLSDDSLPETVVLWKFSNLFHKSFHLPPCVMLSVFKAVSILSPSPTPALLHGLAPSYTKPCCPQTVKRFSEALCGFTLQGKHSTLSVLFNLSQECCDSEMETSEKYFSVLKKTPAVGVRVLAKADS